MIKWVVQHFRGIIRSALFLLFLAGLVYLFYLLIGSRAWFAALSLMAIGVLYEVHNAGEVDPDDENF